MFQIKFCLIYLQTKKVCCTSPTWVGPLMTESCFCFATFFVSDAEPISRTGRGLNMSYFVLPKVHVTINMNNSYEFQIVTRIKQTGWAVQLLLTQNTMQYSRRAIEGTTVHLEYISEMPPDNLQIQVALRLPTLLASRCHKCIAKWLQLLT